MTDLQKLQLELSKLAKLQQRLDATLKDVEVRINEHRKNNSPNNVLYLQPKTRPRGSS